MVRIIIFFFLILLCAPKFVTAQKIDTLSAPKDSLQIEPTKLNQYFAAWQIVLAQNHFLNTDGTPVYLAQKLKKNQSTDVVFYLLAALVLLLELIRFFYDKYFANLFIVFFNTSLKQNQLTDQLIQAKLPSLFFNIFFVISGGVYIYFLMLYFKPEAQNHYWLILLLSIIALAFVYLIKFFTLKITGWLTGNNNITDTYIFIVFLVCKVLGVLLVPFIILIAFCKQDIASSAVIISLIIIILILISRFFKAYGLLQNQLKVNTFHFLLYIVGVEILPLLLIYKGLLVLFSKNL